MRSYGNTARMFEVRPYVVGLNPRKNSVFTKPTRRNKIVCWFHIYGTELLPVAGILLIGFMLLFSIAFLIRS